MNIQGVYVEDARVTPESWDVEIEGSREKGLYRHNPDAETMNFDVESTHSILWDSKASKKQSLDSSIAKNMMFE